MAAQRFELGVVVATPGAVLTLNLAGVFHPAPLLRRHQSGDWGDVPPEDARENELSVREGYRIISSYTLGEDGDRVWLITEADRSATTILLPSEY